MKKSYIFTILLFGATFINASGQTRIYKPFKVDLGMNTIITTDKASGNGMGVYIHPIFNITDRFSFGPRIELGYISVNDHLVSSIFGDGVVDMFSFQAVSDYYLSKDRVRFFIGLGLGVYKQTLILHDFSSFYISVDKTSNVNLGLNPRLGYNVGHFKMAVNYNLAGEGMYDYLGVTLGLDIGGGMYNKY